MDIHKSYSLPFPLAQVYAAWVSSETVIAPATRMEVQPEVGGAYRLFIEDAAGAILSQTEGQFSLVEPEARVRYSWEWNGDGEVTDIDVRFAAEGAKTRITLAHTGFTKPESHAAHDSGWDSYITGFEKKLAAADR